MVQKTVLKVDVSCDKCKKKILKAVSGLPEYIFLYLRRDSEELGLTHGHACSSATSSFATYKLLKQAVDRHGCLSIGVEKIEIDEAKGTLSVTGDADPYEVIVRSRKAGKFAEVISIGPPPAPPKQDGPKKPEEKKPGPIPKPEPIAQMYGPPPPLMPPVCTCCQGLPHVVHVTRREEPTPQCFIL